MCGITGLLLSEEVSPQQRHNLDLMVEALRHRGPDSSGIWVEPDSGVCMGHSRLAIQDTSPAGHQPMLSSSGNSILTFNGEIYNHLEIRTELKNDSEVRWRGTSDTETLLEAIETWGVAKTVSKLRGMFAFAVFNSLDSTLTLARDRFGEKPLYYGYQKGTFFFASDLASLKVHPEFIHKIDRKSLGEYFRYGYVPGPLSIFEGIQKLPPGHYAVLSLKSARQTRVPEIFQYWNYADLIQQNHDASNKASGSSPALHSLLQSVVSDHMISDVPLGLFLSGGIDSSVVTALAQEQSTQPLRTFTIGSTSAVLDESDSARQVAQILGTDHTEFRVSETEAKEILPLVGEIYSEPFADSSQIPSIIVSRLASAEVKVALTGDGGDEIFGGYNRYSRGLATWKQSQRIPRVIRRQLHETLQSRSSKDWVTGLGRLGINGARLGVANLGNKIDKVSQILTSNSLSEYYAALTENGPTAPLKGSHAQLPHYLAHYLDGNSSLDQARRLMIADAITYLPDDILVKVDRASMASSLETRAPLLDVKIAEFASRLAGSDLISRESGKQPLRAILRRYIPAELIERPKLGFGIPLGDWLRGSLRDWVEELINPETLQRDGFLDADVVHKIWLAHLEQRGNTDGALWAILVFQMWLSSNPRAH